MLNHGQDFPLFTPINIEHPNITIYICGLCFKEYHIGFLLLFLLLLLLLLLLLFLQGKEYRIYSIEERKKGKVRKVRNPAPNIAKCLHEEVYRILC